MYRRERTTRMSSRQSAHCTRSHCGFSFLLLFFRILFFCFCCRHRCCCCFSSLSSFSFFFILFSALFSVRIAFEIPWKLCHLSHPAYEERRRKSNNRSIFYSQVLAFQIFISRMALKNPYINGITTTRIKKNPNLSNRSVGWVSCFLHLFLCPSARFSISPCDWMSIRLTMRTYGRTHSERAKQTERKKRERATVEMVLCWSEPTIVFRIFHFIPFFTIQPGLVGCLVRWWVYVDNIHSLVHTQTYQS